MAYSHLYLLVLRSPVSFMSLSRDYKFVFKVAGGILFKNFVGVSVLK